MTENDARAHITVSRETMARIEIFVALLRQRSLEQNLISASTLDTLWARHILDSAQLFALAPDDGLWLDMGSGAGLPGLVIAAMRRAPMVLIEPRVKRCAFLAEAVDAMGLGDRVTIVQSRVETAPPAAAAVISARAVAGLGDLFAMGIRHAIGDAIWVLPKGRTAASEVAVARTSWHARIALEPSVTDSDSAIVIATDVRLRRTPKP